MVASIPKGVYTMKDRLVIINHNANSYRKASKKLKTRILTELSQILNRNRQYIGFLLRNSAKVVLWQVNLQILTDATLNKKSTRGRKKVYGKEVKTPLQRKQKDYCLVYPMQQWTESFNLKEILV